MLVFDLCKLYELYELYELYKLIDLNCFNYNIFILKFSFWIFFVNIEGWKTQIIKTKILRQNT